jgi:hypothetical protein
VTLKWTDVSEVRTFTIIALMMETVRTSETPVHFNMTTRRYIPEVSEFHTGRRENLKYHNVLVLFALLYLYGYITYNL